MSAVLSNASALTSIGIILLAVAVVIVAIWAAVLSVKLSRLKALLLMEQERFALAQAQMTAPPARTGAPTQGGARPGQSVMAPVKEGPSKTVPARMASEMAEEDRVRKPKGRKGKPTIPFGVNKEAQQRAARAYTETADEPNYSPDSIDFNRVQGLTGQQRLTTLQPDAQGVRTVAPRTVEANPRPRGDSRSIEQQTTGRMPAVGVRQTAAETRASFDRVGEEMRRAPGASERYERTARRQRLSERRQQEQMRREAESIVAAHHREMRSINSAPR